MSLVKVAVYGSPLKTVRIDTSVGPRLDALSAQVQQIVATGAALRHSQLQGLQVGDDHPQYTMWQAAETIKALWNFEQEPNIEGVPLTEFIEDVVGNELVEDSTSISWTYGDSANTLQAHIIDEYVQDLVGTMATDSTSIDFTYNDGAGTLTAAVIYANPTGSVGLTAVNGSAATAMRSDAAPALNVAISPTWSGTHTFNNTPVVPNDSWTYAKIQNVSATSRVLGRISSGAGDIEELTGANLLTILSGAGLSAANPTASVGTSAVNGSATTYMRSDAAPAINLTMSPTWSGSHTFSNTATFTNNVPVTFRAVSPQNRWEDTAGSTNQKNWIWIADNNRMSLYAFADDYLTNNEITRWTRSGITPLAMLLIQDNLELQIGASQDLRLYHNGTDSIIENDTGNLILRVNGELSLDEVTSSTSATGGSASALPALPQGYVTVIINGTSRKIAYYAT